MPDGTYAYFATPAFPYLLGCFGPGHVRRPPTGPDAVLMQEQEEEGSATAPFEGGPLPALLEEEAEELAYTNGPARMPGRDLRLLAHVRLPAMPCWPIRPHARPHVQGLLRCVTIQGSSCIHCLARQRRHRRPRQCSRRGVPLGPLLPTRQRLAHHLQVPCRTLRQLQGAREL
jgi:hypothetical protein